MGTSLELNLAGPVPPDLSTAPNEAAPAPAPKTLSVPWYRGLSFLGIVGLLLVLGALALATFLVLQLRGKPLVRVETERLIEQMGNNAVSGLLVRSNEIAALTRTLGVTSVHLPKDVAAVQSTLPALIDFAGDRAVAGGGYWPEPMRFDPLVERRSFFWGRDDKHQLQYFDDYNQPGSGYHHEEWYVPARYMRDGTCYWSQSYMDPYSYQPMVTCTSAIQEAGQFAGVATIDLRLEGLGEFSEAWRQKTGGYVFILDRNNRFITYPQSEQVKRIGQDDKGKRTEEFMTAVEFAAKQPLFSPFAKVLSELNSEVISSAEQLLGPKLAEIAAQIDKDSYQIDAEQARLIAAITSDPLRERFSIERSTLYRSFELPNDAVLGKPALAFVFSVPSSYWKLVVVKPVSEATAVADSIARSLAVYLLLTSLLVMGITYFLLNRSLIHPLELAARVMQRIGELISERKYLELREHRLLTDSRNEIGMLGRSFNNLVDRVVDNEGQLARINQTLELRVRERTAALSNALEQLKASQTRLIQSEKMASLGQMVAGVAHEINTPLGYVKNNVLMAQDFVSQFQRLVNLGGELGDLLSVGDASEEQLSAKLAEVASTAAELRDAGSEEDLRQLFADTAYGIEQISELVVNLRNFSRLDEARLKDTDLHECIENTLMIAKNVLKTRVTVEKNYGELPLISCSPSQINQVLLNLFNNAAQAIEGEGTITITTHADADFVYVAIQDNGKGIPQEVLTRIFEPFFTTKKVGEGTGLGLAIVLQIIQQHGGRIRVGSRPNVGTKFLVSLPRQRVRAISGEAE